MPPANVERSITFAIASRGAALVAVAACHFAALAAIASGLPSLGRQARPEPVFVSLLPPPQATGIQRSEPPRPPAPTAELQPDPPTLTTPPPPAIESLEMGAPPAPRAKTQPPVPRTTPDTVATVPPQRSADASPARAAPAQPIEERPAEPPLAPKAVAEKPGPPALLVAAVDPASRPGAALSPARVDPSYLGNAKPRYPLAARRRGEEGTVLLEVDVAADGQVIDLRIERSSSSERLDRAALRAVADWRFIAARQAGVAVASSIQLPIVFRLED